MIVWNSFSPALTDGVLNSSATGGNWTPRIWRRLEQRFGKVFNVSVGEQSDYDQRFSFAISSKITACILIWRWPMPAYKQRDKAYERQMELLDIAKKRKIPVLIHDQDLKGGALESADELLSAGCPCLLTAPMLNPWNGYTALHFPPLGAMPPVKSLTHKLYDYMYVGNNYERYSQAKRVFGGDRMRDMKAVFYGNWLDPNPERESPAVVLRDFPLIDFKGRLPQDKVIEELAKARFTYHLAKPEYCDTGMVTLRWYEAAMAGTVAILPFEFCIDKSDGAIFKPSSEEVLRLMTDDEHYMQILQWQREFVRSKFSDEAWVKAVERLVGDFRS